MISALFAATQNLKVACVVSGEQEPNTGVVTRVVETAAEGLMSHLFSAKSTTAQTPPVSAPHVEPKRLILVEIDEDQADRVEKMAVKLGAEIVS
jgi:hypothetical protein